MNHVTQAIRESSRKTTKKGNEEHEQELYILARFKQCASILDFMMRAEVRCNGIPLCLGQEGKKTHLLDNYVKESEVPSLVSDKDKFSF